MGVSMKPGGVDGDAVGAVFQGEHFGESIDGSKTSSNHRAELIFAHGQQGT